jgi:hypothetical protein
MADWDANSPRLEANLQRVLDDIRQAAARREPPSAARVQVYIDALLTRFAIDWSIH